jgi:hypothetical protein
VARGVNEGDLKKGCDFKKIEVSRKECEETIFDDGLSNDVARESE